MGVPSIYRFVEQKTNIDMLSKLLDIPNIYVTVESAECGQKRTTRAAGMIIKTR